MPTLPSVNICKEKTNLVGVGERTIAEAVQIDKHALQIVKDVLDKKTEKRLCKKTPK